MRKTRLALRAATDLKEAFEDGAWWVELAPLSDPELVPQAVASVISVPEQPDLPLMEALAASLHEKQVLLVLDNCEHMIGACAEFAQAMLLSCPQLKILATSREALGVAGEMEWRVPPLPVPEEDHTPSVEEAARSEAVRLFVERARSKQAGFSLSNDNAPAVVQVSRNLDGIPLAIELAAAWVGTLSVGQIVERLGDPLRLLTRGGRKAEARQRTLRGALAWSYDLLSGTERTLFGRLSVFAGGWTLEAAEAVGEGNGIERDEVLTLLSALVEKSLVVAKTEEVASPRFEMLETVRQYGRERLEASGEAEVVRLRHAAFFLALAEETEADLKGSLQLARLEELQTEHDNLGAALGWSLDRGKWELGLRLAGTLGEYWRMSGRLSEGRRWLEIALTEDDASSAPIRVKALNRAGSLAILQGDERATALLEEGLRLLKGLGDRAGAAAALSDLGHAMLYSQGDQRRLSELREEAEAMRQQPLDRRATTHLLSFLALAALGEGDYERAATLAEENLTLHREVENTRGIVMHLTVLGMISLLMRDHERAMALLEEDLRLSRRLGDRINVVYCLLVSAGVSAERGRQIRAARLWGAAETLQETSGVAAVSPLIQSHYDYDGRVAAARALVDETSWETAWSEGEAMTFEEATEYALSEEESTRAASSASASDLAGLSAREIEVLKLVAEGLTNVQVANVLFISPRTVNGHLNSIYAKLGASSRAAATRFAVERGLL
jgi:predicted ATPase/DNA-binding CsgD family transcriptional regulator